MYRVWKEMENLQVAQSPNPVEPLGRALQISQNECLFTDQLIAASFSRLVKEDSSVFASAILPKIPIRTELISSLGYGLYECNRMLNRNCPWDWQWSPHALARFQSGKVADDVIAEVQEILRVSLILHQLLLQKEGTDWGSTSLGFLAKTVSDGR